MGILEYSRQKAKSSRVLKTTLLNIGKEKAELSNYLYDTSDEGQVNFVSQIEQLGTTTTGALVETTSLSLSDETPQSLNGNFSVKGTWPQVFYFLRLLEEFPARLLIKRIDVKGNQNDWNGTVEVSLMSLKSPQ